MNKKIIGISGKKRAGKDSAKQYLLSKLFSNEIGDSFQCEQYDNRKLLIVDGNEPYIDSFDDEIINKLNCAYKKEFNTSIDFCYSISCATPLKEFMINTLGLNNSQVNGTDEEKNAPTKYTWELASDEIRLKFNKQKNDYMSSRHIMEYIGTFLLRRQFYDNLFADGLINSINKINAKYIFVPDLRFPNEVDSILNAGGKIIRLTRDLFPDNKSEPETALDSYNFNNNKNIKIINNNNISLNEKNKKLDLIIPWILENE